MNVSDSKSLRPVPPFALHAVATSSDAAVLFPPNASSNSGPAELVDFPIAARSVPAIRLMSSSCLRPAYPPLPLLSPPLVRVAAMAGT